MDIKVKSLNHEPHCERATLKRGERGERIESAPGMVWGAGLGFRILFTLKSIYGKKSAFGRHVSHHCLRQARELSPCDMV